MFFVYLFTHAQAESRWIEGRDWHAKNAELRTGCTLEG